MRRIKLVLDYLGTRFCGWQIQPGKDTVQQRLETALEKLTGEKISVVASGRTDSGVHAMAQTVHFDTQTDFDLVAYVRGTNNYLPEDIRVLKAQEVSDRFHARFDAVKKTYMYRLYVADEDRAIYHNKAVRVNTELDLDAINSACKLLEGEHDFTSFMSCGSEVKSTVRTIFEAKAEKINGEYYFFFTANGFLYNMVRKMSACLIRIGQGKMQVDEISKHLLNPSKTALTLVAPACGLYLYSVEY